MIQPCISTLSGGKLEKKKNKFKTSEDYTDVRKKSALMLPVNRRSCEMQVTQLIAYVSGSINTELHIIKIQIIGRILKEYWWLY